MKKMILYVMMMGIAIAINSCEKETLEPSSVYSINFSPFTLGSGYRISFDASLNKSEYQVGEEGYFNMGIIGIGPGGLSLCDCSFNDTYTGTLYIEGKSIGLFSGTPASLICDQEHVRKTILFSAPPSNYNAKISVTRYYKILLVNATDTKEVSIPYEVR